MLRVEEYIARRKKEDKLNEFETGARIENIRTCVNYVFEYFNNYLDITGEEEKTVSKNAEITRFGKQLQDYDPEVRDWVLGIYSDHHKVLTRAVDNALKENEFFFLFSTDQEFRNTSYDCYSKLIGKNPFLKDKNEMLLLLIKDYHRVKSQKAWQPEFPFISDGINNWIEETWHKHGVNVIAFAENWTNHFWDHQDIWPASHRRKSQESWRKYDYDFKQGSNLFNLNSLYIRMPKKSFTRGRKQDFEILMMYFWLNQIVGDDQDYWQEYLEKVLTDTNAHAIRLN